MSKLERTPVLAFTFLAISTAACGGAAEGVEPVTPAASVVPAPPPAPPPKVVEARRPLKAVLFPYIPDAGGDGFRGLIAMLESEFEQKNPAIDLQIAIDPNQDLYDLAPAGELSTTA